VVAGSVVRDIRIPVAVSDSAFAERLRTSPHGLNQHKETLSRRMK
jgi:hypothetical protein